MFLKKIMCFCAADECDQGGAASACASNNLGKAMLGHSRQLGVLRIRAATRTCRMSWRMQLPFAAVSWLGRDSMIVRHLKDPPPRLNTSLATGGGFRCIQCIYFTGSNA